MKAVLNTHLHLDRLVLERNLFNRVVHDEFFFLCDFVVITVDRDIDEVAETDNDAIIAFKLFLYSIERESVLDRIGEDTCWLQFLSKVNEVCSLALIEEVLNHTNQLHLNTQMIQL